MTDTDGIYDNCRCGERPQIEGRISFADNAPEFRASCQSCGEATKWHGYRAAVMVEWNRKMRGAQ
jgi:hypothetical protein